MKIIFKVVLLLVLAYTGVVAQTRTITGTGDWDDPAKWQSSAIADTEAENVAFSGGPIKTITVPSDYSVTVGNIALDNDAMVVDGTIDVGSTYPTNQKNVTASNGPSLTIGTDGSMTIWGDLIVNNNLSLDIQGTLIIKGNVELKNGASLSVSGTGSLEVNGDFSAEQNTTIATSGSGTIAVGGDFDIGGGSSSITGPAGSISVGGICTSATGLCTSSPLPVELNLFTATLSGEFVDLYWSTASQLNFSHFEVEHSVNGSEWSELTQVQGEGTTSEQNTYIFTHLLPHNGRNYYRLKMVDTDQSFEYSNIESVIISANNSFVISPNPVKGGVVRYEMNFLPTEGDQLFVYDLMGAFVLSSTVSSLTQELTLPNSLAKGTYLVYYKGKGVNQAVRLIVE